MNFAYYNGKITPFEETSVPLTDRALYFGDGVYDVVTSRNGRLYQFEEHYLRLEASCRAIRLPFTVSRRELLSIIHRLCDLSQLPCATVYIQASRRSARRMHELGDEREANLLVIVSPFTSYESREVSAITLPDERHGICNVKSLNLLGSVLALAQASASGCDCAILVKDGYVTEEARSNVFILRDKTVITRPTDRRILAGIMRANLLRTASGLGLTVEERPFTEKEMLSAEEIIVSSTTKFLYRVVRLNGVPCRCSNGELYFTLRERMLRDFLHETD